MAEENQTTEDVSRETTLESYTQAQESADTTDTTDITDRPEWLPEKFKSEKDLAEAYSNLEKKIGQKEEDLKKQWEEELQVEAYKDRPEKVGDYILPENIDQSMSADDPLLKWWADYSFENGSSQEEFSTGIEKYIERINANIPDPETEMKRLGDNGEERVQAVELWSNKFFPDTLRQSIESITETADGIMVLEHFMEQMKDRPNVQSESPNKITMDSLRELQKDPRYHDPVARDADFVKMVDEGYKRLYPNGT
tara:strand:+ start:2953 stop:3714 length:762 start_codon:yes stop_codon:yes gene_type:complete